MENKYNNVVEAKITVLVNFDKPNDGIKAMHLIPLFGMAACLSLNDLSEDSLAWMIWTVILLSLYNGGWLLSFSTQIPIPYV